jgi:hypothetical protein
MHTYNINGSPAQRVAGASSPDNQTNQHDTRHAADADAQNTSADALARSLPEAPQRFPEHAESQGAQHNAVRGEGDVVLPNRRLGLGWVSRRILRTNGRVREEESIGEEVEDEAECVDCGKVNGRPYRGMPPDVEDWLRIE